MQKQRNFELNGPTASWNIAARQEGRRIIAFDDIQKKEMLKLQLLCLICFEILSET